jgi:hypothetical protein
MSGASLPATKAAAVHLLGRVTVSVKVPAVRSGSQGWRANGSCLFTPPCSSPLSVPPRPRVAARSPMSGASLAGDGGGRMRGRTAQPVFSGSAAPRRPQNRIPNG